MEDMISRKKMVDASKNKNEPLKTDQNAPLEEFISRKKAIDAHYEYCNKHPDAGFPVWSLKILENLPSAQPDLPIKEKCAFCPHCNNCDVNDDLSIQPCMDTISRQAAIDALNVGAELLRRVLDDADIVGAERAKYEWGLGLIESYIADVKALPSAQPERLTDDDFETIRIHLNAYKEKLCNQQRWEEADEYQRILDRFMAFASAQPTLYGYNIEHLELIGKEFRKETEA